MTHTRIDYFFRSVCGIPPNLSWRLVILWSKQMGKRYEGRDPLTQNQWDVWSDSFTWIKNAPIENITSIWALMQIAVQNHLIIHWMDFKTAYLLVRTYRGRNILRATKGFWNDIRDWREVCVEVFFGCFFLFLYGQKQSKRKLDKLLNDHLAQDNFVWNLSDHCAYRKQVESDVLLVIIRIEDLIIAESNNNLLNKFNKTIKSRFNL